MVFLTPPLFAAVVFLWTLRLDESLPSDKRGALNWAAMGRSIRNVMSNSTFLRYTSITTLLFAALSTYVASSEHIVGEIYGRPELFAWIFASIGLLMSMCSFANSFLSSRFGARLAMRWLLVGYAIVSGLLFIVTVITNDPPDMVLFFIAVALLMAINLAVEPNSSALALEPMGDMAGMASAIYGTCFFFVGSSLGSIVSYFMVNGVAPLVVSFVIIGIVTVLLAFSDRRAFGGLNTK
jgi:DHA1 family bicyclomycin/chloramphenicol resistance-like MFS transporter